MKPLRRTIHIVKHVPTGAKVPVVIKSMNKNNVITDYKEVTEGRKAFTLQMLQDRWDKCKEDVMALLQQYQVPAHLNFPDTKTLEPGQLPIDVAFFFEEYIKALEQKAKIPHSKLKPKLIEVTKHH